MYVGEFGKFFHGFKGAWGRVHHRWGLGALPQAAAAAQSAKCKVAKILAIENEHVNPGVFINPLWLFLCFSIRAICSSPWLCSSCISMQAAVQLMHVVVEVFAASALME
jgi:hypothetical protein